MSGAIFPIVEGHGEVSAVPELLRRLAHEKFFNYSVEILPPFRLPRGKIVKFEELNRVLEYGARKISEYKDGGIIVLIFDADGDCPAQLGPRLLEQVRNIRPNAIGSVVVAKEEYESWFLASAVSMRGRGRIKNDANRPNDPESIRDAKGYIERELFASGKYSETVDQVILTSFMDFDEARFCDSFDKLYRDLEIIMTPTIM